MKIRYAHPGAAATVFPGENGTARVRCTRRTRAVTPGQAAVCYRGDEVLGGGWIVPPARGRGCARLNRARWPRKHSSSSPRGPMRRAPAPPRGRSSRKSLAACGNLVPGVESIYRWQGAVETSAEVLVIFKTTIGRYPQLETRIKALHSYEVPEIVALRVADGLPAYLRWVESSCASSW